MPLIHNFQASLEAQLKPLACGKAPIENLDQYIRASISLEEDQYGGVLAPCRYVSLFVHLYQGLQ